MIPLGDVPVLFDTSRIAVPYYGRATAGRLVRLVRRLHARPRPQTRARRIRPVPTRRPA